MTINKVLFQLFAICFWCALTPALVSAGEVTPAIYLGYGTGTNIGGEIGIGTEVKFDPYFSVNAAVGIWNDIWPAHSGDQSKAPHFTDGRVILEFPQPLLKIGSD